MEKFTFIYMRIFVKKNIEFLENNNQENCVSSPLPFQAVKWS
jgi:hypothetical protein